MPGKTPNPSWALPSAFRKRAGKSHAATPEAAIAPPRSRVSRKCWSTEAPKISLACAGSPAAKSQTPVALRSASVVDCALADAALSSFKTSTAPAFLAFKMSRMPSAFASPKTRINNFASSPFAAFRKRATVTSAGRSLVSRITAPSRPEGRRRPSATGDAVEVSAASPAGDRSKLPARKVSKKTPLQMRR